MAAYITLEMDSPLADLVTRYVDARRAYHATLSNRLRAEGEGFAADHMRSSAQTIDAALAAVLPRILIDETARYEAATEVESQRLSEIFRLLTPHAIQS